MALNSLFCADVPLSNYSLTHSTRDDDDASDLRFSIVHVIMGDVHYLYVEIVGNTMPFSHARLFRIL